MNCPRCSASYLAADPECPQCGLPFPTVTATPATAATAATPATTTISAITATTGRADPGRPRTTRNSERPWILRGASVIGVLLGAFLVLHFIGPGGDGQASTWRPSDLPDLGASADSSPTAGTLPQLGADGIPTAENLAAAGAVKADRTADPGKDGAGRTITYGAENLVDGKAETAWRVPGFGTGEAITITLAAKSKIQVVGLSNGYTKVDATSGEDQYDKGRRILSVTWIFDGGLNVNQSLEDDDRNVQLLEIPEVQAQSVKLLINSTTDPGQFTNDYTAISEIYLGAG
jgi:hypothetical protein